MNKIKLLLISIGVSGVLFFVPVSGFGQVTVEPSYEVSFHILMGSNNADSKANLPSNLSAVAQQLRSKVAYSNFRLAGTMIGRMANQGSYEYKSFSDLFGQDPKFRSFLDLSVRGLKNTSAEKGAGIFQFQDLRFAARVPVIVGFAKDGAGKDQPSVSFEQIGMTLGKIGLVENVPTLIGTLDVPNGTDMLFLVMTIKTVER